MQRQDTRLEELTAILKRQKHLGIAIGDEIEKQINMLDGLEDSLERFGNKLGKAEKNLRRLD